ncbi:hypothetical protein GCM10010918_30510 [Paenibacillus radicis (ex Gao et al. 2016)]|uniref:Knr4/Smi1-like domain-containing protein n=1 Tax=Paenibacillus radicis (ex Gao et al. 2016) TaxID=1737354 RepID=A0A917HAB2_9BACL|nr:hypothetical protein GCM10010918_30510 [Paenibacillus radicis (ex Gao et al. 2016)]
MENQTKQIDEAIVRMQAALQVKREQDPEFYAKYPAYLKAEAEEQAIRSVAVNWRLPDDYLYFLNRYVPESVAWSTDEYINLTIYSAKDLLKGQWGYNYNPVTEEDISDWPSSYLVIASDEGNPYCIDLYRGDTVIYTAEHGTGSWNFSIAYDNLIAFLHSTLLPKGFEEEDISEGATYKYCKIVITGQGRDKVKTLLFLKKRFSCDYSQVKSYLETAPLLVYKGGELGASSIESQLKDIGAEYEKHEISLHEFLENRCL